MAAGVDGGLLVDVGDTTRTGFVVRPVLTIGVVTAFYRYGHFFDDDPDDRFHEAVLREALVVVLEQPGELLLEPLADRRRLLEARGLGCGEASRGGEVALDERP